MNAYPPRRCKRSLLGIAAVVVAMTGCGDGGSNSAPSVAGTPGSASMSVSPSPFTPTALAYVSQPPATDVPEAGSYREVDVATEVFATPGDTSSTWTRIERDTLVYVLEGNRDAGWYHIEFSIRDGGVPEDVFGWIEAERNSTELLRPVSLSPCPDIAPDVTWIAGMSAAERLSCFGDSDLTFKGYIIGRSAAGALYTGEPAWLANEAEQAIVQNQGPALEGGQLELHFSPDIDVSAPPGAFVAITGHFDDARAESCRRRGTTTAVPDPTESESVLWCRQRFVVESVDHQD